MRRPSALRGRAARPRPPAPRRAARSRRRPARRFHNQGKRGSLLFDACLFGIHVGVALVVIGLIGGAVGNVIAGGVGVGAGALVRVFLANVFDSTAAVRREPIIERRSRASWRRSRAAMLLSLPLRLAFGPLGEVKLEEWLADLAAIESRWQRWVYLLDLLGDLPWQARAARHAESPESR